ncbi:hypothetical protein OAJ02_02310 [Nitrosopumilus sp.]|nr:hypothetical protein [Nitrosopumilus sp.]
MKKFRDFESARKFVHKLKIENVRLWRDYCNSGKKPENIPKSPNYAYKKEWISWMDWLGVKYVPTQKRTFKSFDQARRLVHKLGLQSTGDWKQYCKSGNKPQDIPSAPDKKYIKNWIDWSDWLGHGDVTKSRKQWRTFENARKYVRKLNLKNQKEWITFYQSNKRPVDIPATPERTYKNEWKGLGDWLGTGTVATQNRKYSSFREAKKFVHSLNLKSMKYWREYCKSGDKPDNIPNNPWYLYKNKGWNDMGDWLGTGNIAPSEMVFLPFLEAKEFVRKLNLKTIEQWREYCKSGDKPNNIPSAPWSTYKEWKK